ncbi:MAG TPA: EAL domain-containing protein [Terriglobus sp.]
MRSSFFDLVLLPVLIVFFGVLQASRPQRRFRLWLAGWICVMLSFLLWLPQGQGPHEILWMEAGRLLMLLLGGLLFVFSFGADTISSRALAVKLSVIIIAPAIVLAGSTYGLHQPGYIAACILLGEAIAIYIAWCILGRQSSALPWIVLLSIACIAVKCVLLAAGDVSGIVACIFIQIFLACVILLLASPLRKHLGAWVCAFGFFGWAVMYVLYMLTDSHPGWIPTLNQTWNLPKYIAAIGMILMVMELDTTKIKVLSEEYRLLYESNPHPMWIFDPETAAFLSVNDAAVAAYGYTREEFMSMTLFDMYSEEDHPRLRETLRHPPAESRQYWRHRRKDGTLFDVDTSGHDVMFQGNKGRFITAMDITEQERNNRELVYRAQHDPLTGLANRMLLEDREQQALARSARDGNKVAIITIDVDRFKKINDTYGHAVGDECLKEIANRLQSRVRDADTLARTGGEEFTVMVGGLPSIRGAQGAANALLSAFNQPLHLSNNEISVSVSIGIALYPDDGLDMETIRKRSDNALYKAKRMGGGCAVMANEQSGMETHSATDVEAALRQALSSGLLQVYYQPIYNREGHLARVEALVRGTQDYLLKAGPGVFIPIAEESGLILPLGQWVLNEACRQVAEWRTMDVPHFELAVNVSARQLVQPNFAEKVLQTLKHHNLPPQILHLELTETTLMNDFSSMIHSMKRLAEAGVLFSIDDFGTGYSSLARLSELPISTVKIDRSFVLKLTDNAPAVGIVRAIVHMSRHLNLEIVAEGVENAEHIRILRELGCDLFQGFYLGRPLAPDALVEKARRDAIATPFQDSPQARLSGEHRTPQTQP